MISIYQLFKLHSQLLEQTNLSCKAGWSTAKPDVRPHLPTSTSHLVHSFTRSLAFPRTRPQSSPHCAAMPSSLRSALPRNLSRPLDNTSVFYCTSCSTWRRALSTRAGARSTGINKINSSRRSGRLLESPASVTIRPFATSVITAGKTVPPRFKELYDALNGVENAAIQEVSISRLQLALRSLESEAPLIRVAGEFCPAQWPSIWLLRYFVLDRL